MDGKPQWFTLSKHLETPLTRGILLTPAQSEKKEHIKSFSPSFFSFKERFEIVIYSHVFVSLHRGYCNTLFTAHLFSFTPPSNTKCSSEQAHTTPIFFSLHWSRLIFNHVFKILTLEALNRHAPDYIIYQLLVKCTAVCYLLSQAQNLSVFPHTEDHRRTEPLHLCIKAMKEFNASPLVSRFGKILLKKTVENLSALSRLLLRFFWYLYFYRFLLGIYCFAQIKSAI